MVAGTALGIAGCGGSDDPQRSPANEPTASRADTGSDASQPEVGTGRGIEQGTRGRKGSANRPVAPSPASGSPGVRSGGGSSGDDGKKGGRTRPATPGARAARDPFRRDPSETDVGAALSLEALGQADRGDAIKHERRLTPEAEVAGVVDDLRSRRAAALDGRGPATNQVVTGTAPTPAPTSSRAGAPHAVTSPSTTRTSTGPITAPTRSDGPTLTAVTPARASWRTRPGPCGIALDAGVLYSADYSNGTIGRAHTDGTHVNESFITSGRSLRHRSGPGAPVLG